MTRPNGCICWYTADETDMSLNPDCPVHYPKKQRTGTLKKQWKIKVAIVSNKQFDHSKKGWKVLK